MEFPALRGRSILVVEDEALIGLDIRAGIIDQASPQLAPDSAISRLLRPATFFVTGSLLALFGVALAGWGVIATLVDRVM